MVKKASKSSSKSEFHHKNNKKQSINMQKTTSKKAMDLKFPLNTEYSIILNPDDLPANFNTYLKTLECTYEGIRLMVSQVPLLMALRVPANRITVREGMITKLNLNGFIPLAKPPVITDLSAKIIRPRGTFVAPRDDEQYDYDSFDPMEEDQFLEGLLKALPEALGDLTWLEELDLNRNEIKTLPVAIGKLSNLRILKMDWNGISEFPPQICHCISLQSVSLYRNRITQIPEEIGQCTQLRELNLANNQLKRLPPGLNQLHNLTVLSLEYNYLSRFDLELKSFPGLTKLNLSYNLIAELPPNIDNLHHLEHLELWNNNLRSLPPSIGNLSKLKSLALENNRIAELCPEIGSLSNLKILNLSGNLLESFPPSMAKLKNLTILIFGHNKFTVFPDCVCSMTALKYLSSANDGHHSHFEDAPLYNTLPTPYYRSIEKFANTITVLPPSIMNLTRLEHLIIQDEIDTTIEPNHSLVYGLLKRQKCETLTYIWKKGTAPRVCKVIN